MHKYNTLPDYWREIPQREFSRIFFQYVLKPMESRQMCYNTKGEHLKKSFMRARLFEISYDGWAGLGVAIVDDDHEIKFYQYGHPKIWISNEEKFAAQFAGDNS